MGALCGICHKNESKYKCPKCRIRYCSLSCFKDAEKHVHTETDVKDETKASAPPAVVPSISLASTEMNDVYQNTPELKELLKYNTVKFHLAKVYKILTADVSGDDSTVAGGKSGSGHNMSTEYKKQLAVDYLNTLRYGGIHYNEAVEEFCTISLRQLNKKE